MASKAFITGVSGRQLTACERTFLDDHRPFGLILFDRNCEVASQIADLVAAFRDAVGRSDALVLIDQEGGRVQRLKPPAWPAYPAAAAIGRVADQNRAERAAWLAARLIADDLAELGVNVDCLPVLDLPAPGSHEIIGDRAYGADGALVARLGRATAGGLVDGGVLPVMKHIPGHGRAGADSHLTLPVVEVSEAELVADFAPFVDLADLPMAMTAHIVYSAIDPDRPATLSPKLVESVIRGRIGFDGLLMTDDISMAALTGDIRDRATGSLAAGCDLVLHCNGDFAEMLAVAAATPELSGRSADRADAAMRWLAPPQPFDRDAGWRELSALLAGDRVSAG